MELGTYIVLLTVACQVGEAGQQGIGALDHPLIVELLLGLGADGIVVRDQVSQDLD